MGKLLYVTTLYLYRLVLLVSQPFHEKARKMLEGRKGSWPEVEKKMKAIDGKVAWFHCASLGEFEQGRPVIEQLLEQYPSLKIVVTFFSPSGYEVRKNYAKAHAVFYLPFDSPGNAKRFISLINPVIVYFVKYEFWHFYLRELNNRSIPVLSISSIFRPGQLFFKPYGRFYRKILERFEYIFVQNKTSEDLLRSVGIGNVAISGDTRFDRVYQICSNPSQIPIAEKFKGKSKVFVIGSSWPNDIEVIYPFINKWRGKLKFIIAPHELAEKNLRQIEELAEGKVARFSKANTDSVAEYDVLLIDNIGMLSSLYSYGQYAYVGGSFNSGLHNTLEAAAYGIPIFFGRGRKNIKYQEAVDLTALGGAFEIGAWQELNAMVENLFNHPEHWNASAQASKDYIMNNLGATEKIISYSEKHLKHL